MPDILTLDRASKLILELGRGPFRVILRYDKHTTLPGRDKGSETHQVFGNWSGRLRTDDTVEIEVEGVQGFAEEARQER